MTPPLTPRQLSLYGADGRRKYLTIAEGGRVLDTAASFDLPTAALACLLTCSGCRLSEALELTRFQLDLEACAVIFRTLKRRQLHYRAVPIPQDLMEMLLIVAESRPGESRLWGWCRQTGWRRVKAVMAAAGIEGPHACPKGLRHAYGVACALSQVDPDLTRRMLGHTKLETTAIYQQVIGPEAQAILTRLWARLRQESAPER